MKRVTRVLALLSLVSATGFGLALGPGCGGEEGAPSGPGPGPAPPDTIPPSAVTDLRVKFPTAETLPIVWSSPGDDGNSGTASCYEIRFSKSAITDDNWSEAPLVDAACIPPPKPAGRIETVVVQGLRSGTQYYFALKTFDEVPNESAISNCATERTLDEAYPPSSVTDLVVTAISSAATSSTWELTWTAPGDDYMIGTASQYEIRYSRYPIIDDASWSAAAPTDTTPPPKPAGQKETFRLTLTNLLLNQFFALKTADELGNWSGLSNLAPGLAVDAYMWASPPTVCRGQSTYIVFRASPSDLTRVSCSNQFSAYCGDKVLCDVAYERFGGGVHMVAFDFYNNVQHDYYPYDYYLFKLCWGGEEMASTIVRFVE